MRPALGFIALAVIAGLLIGATRLRTADVIAQNYAEAEAAVVAELLGGNLDLTASARLCRTEVRGYAGVIRLLVLPAAPENTSTESSEGLRDGFRNGPKEKRNEGFKIEAVRVLSHSETPGIGDFIELRNSPWIRGFEGLQASADHLQDWDSKIDAVSGATVTRRAVLKGVARACLNSPQ